jgi:hypothetical protein
VSDADRERELRRLERDRRRRERGQAGYFEEAPKSIDVAEADPYTTAETIVIPPELVGRADAAPPRRLAVAAAIFAVATGLSRVLGLVREVVA